MTVAVQARLPRSGGLVSRAPMNFICGYACEAPTRTHVLRVGAAAQCRGPSLSSVGLRKPVQSPVDPVDQVLPVEGLV